MTIVNGECYYCSAKRERGTCQSTRWHQGCGIGRAGFVRSERRPARERNPDRRICGAIPRRNHPPSSAARTPRKIGPKRTEPIKNAIRRCISFITGGIGDPGLVRDELREREVRKLDIEKQIQSARDSRPIAMHPNVARLYAKKVAQLQTLLTCEETRQKATDIIRSMIDRIEVHSTNDPKTPEIILKGALASILAFASTGSDPDATGRFMVVAGAGSHLYRTAAYFAG